MSKRILRSLFGLSCLSCLLALLAPALADQKSPVWQGVYEGTIGQAHIVAALGEDSARYFYLGKADDLGLIVSAAGTALTLQETLAPSLSADDLKDNPKLATGLWKVTFGNGGLSGQWTDTKGQHLRLIALRRISTADETLYASADTLHSPGAYGALWLRGAPALVAETKDMTLGPLTYRLRRDPQFGDNVPRLLRAPSNVNVAAVNRALDRLQTYLRLQDRDCFQGLRAMRARTPDGKLADVDKPDEDAPAVLKATYATDRLLTLEESRSIFCGGAHPDLVLRTYTFDLADGAQLTSLGFTDKDDDLGPNGLGRALDLARPQKKAKFDALWMNAMRAAIIADRKGAKPADDDCGKLIEDALAGQVGAGDRAVYPTAKGLAVRFTGLPSVARTCEDQDPYNPIVVPYSALKPFLKPGQTLLPQ